MEYFFRTMFEQFFALEPFAYVQMLVMLTIGCVLVYLAIGKKMEPTLLLPLGFGTIIVNLPLSGAIGRLLVRRDLYVLDELTGEIVAQQGWWTSEGGPIPLLYEFGIATELFPLLLFVGIGAMIDFGPLLANPKLLFFGAAAHVGVYLTLVLAAVIGHYTDMFTLQDAAAIAAIGTADGPTAIFVSNYYRTPYMGAILVAAYSYMALVPIIQPPCIRLVTTRRERMIRMPYARESVSKQVRIIFPIVVTIVAGIIVPRAVALVGFLMFGNLMRECLVTNSLSDTAQNALANIITIILGIAVAFQMHYAQFLRVDTLIVMALGLFAFAANSVGGVLFAKVINLFAKNKMNPMIGACGISAFPMSSRVIHKMGLKEDPQNFLLMHAAGVNVGGQISSVIIGGLLLGMIPRAIG